MLDEPVTFTSDDFVVVAASDHHSGLAFQRAPDHTPPPWPGPGQQLHLDVMVDDLGVAAVAVESLGARALGGDHVYADPAGHPFCLIRRPGWAEPIAPGRR